MLLGIALAGVPCLALVALLHRRTGSRWAWSLGLLLWSLAAIGFVTLIPTDGAPGVVYADQRYYNTCSFDYGGPAPEGFWILSGGQRLLNVVVFVPSGALLTLVLARWRTAWWTVPVGLVGTERLQPVGSSVPRIVRVDVRFGAPIEVAGRFEGMASGRARRVLTDEVMDAIAGLTGQERAPGYNERAPDA